MTTTKDVLFSSKARIGIKKGVDILADAVKVTLGPKGRNVIIEQPYGPPRTTKDGVTVAKSITLKDRLENMGAQLIKEVASKTNDIAGDGTTTSTVLAQAIYGEGIKAVEAGMNPMDIKRGIDMAVQIACAHIKEQSSPIKDSSEIAKIGTISANGESEIGNMIADAMDKVGKEGVITVEEAKSLSSELETVDGMQFDCGYLSPYFVTNQEKMVAELDNPFILFYSSKLSNLQSLIPLLEAVMQSTRPLLIVAEDVDGEALTTLVVNKVRAGFKVAAVKAPSFGEKRKLLMEDMAILTGGTLISESIDIKLENVTLEMLGTATKVRITKDTTTIIDESGLRVPVTARACQIRQQIADTKDESEKEFLRERLAKLTGGVAVIRVGGTTETEVKERKDRVDDALQATRAAVEEGIVPGGGTALLYATRALNDLYGENEDQNVGINIIRKALQAPIRQIVSNAGCEGSLVVGELLKQDVETFGYDAQEGVFKDLVVAGIIDPAKVVRVALQDAASIAGLMITTEAAIVDTVEEVKKPIVGYSY